MVRRGRRIAGPLFASTRKTATPLITNPPSQTVLLLGLVSLFLASIAAAALPAPIGSLYACPPGINVRFGVPSFGAYCVWYCEVPGSATQCVRFACHNTFPAGQSCLFSDDDGSIRIMRSCKDVRPEPVPRQGCWTELDAASSPAGLGACRPQWMARRRNGEESIDKRVGRGEHAVDPPVAPAFPTRRDGEECPLVDALAPTSE